MCNATLHNRDFIFFLFEKRMSVTQNSSQKQRAWRHQAPHAQKRHVLLLLGHLDVPAAKLRTLSLPNKTTDYSTVCNTQPGRSHIALCCAKHCTKVCISPDHLPPTSPAMTTILALPPVPHNSGYLSSFRFRACLGATPLVVFAFLRGVPSPWCADTNAASRTSCTPPKRDKPSAICANQSSPARCPSLSP